MNNWDGNRPAGIPLDMADQSKVALLRVDNVTKQFPGVRALSQVNLSLHEAEVLPVRVRCFKCLFNQRSVIQGAY